MLCNGTTWRINFLVVRIWRFSSPYFPVFRLNTERYRESLRIQSECGKIRTRKTPNTDTFYAVLNYRVNSPSSFKKYLEMGIMFFSHIFLHRYTFKCKAKIRSNTRVRLTEFFRIYMSLSNFIENKSRLASRLFLFFRP